MHPAIERFGLNTHGRDFLISDNHGCWDEVREFMAHVSFNEDADRLFHAGDMVDRGPQSMECLEWIEKPWFHAIRGNHEEIGIEVAAGRPTQRNLLRNGVQWFLDMPPELQKAYAQVYLTLPYVFEIIVPWGKVGVVHGEPLETMTSTSWNLTVDALDGFRTLSDTAKKDIVEVLLWSRMRFHRNLQDEVTDIDRVYVGHTPVLAPTVLGNVHYIDTAVVYGNRLTVVNLTEDTLLQVPAKRQHWRK